MSTTTIRVEKKIKARHAIELNLLDPPVADIVEAQIERSQRIPRNWLITKVALIPLLVYVIVSLFTTGFWQGLISGLVSSMALILTQIFGAKPVLIKNLHPRKLPNQPYDKLPNRSFDLDKDVITGDKIVLSYNKIGSRLKAG